MTGRHVGLLPDKTANFCRRHHTRKLSPLGSVLRDDFTPNSEVEVRVEFEPDRTPGLLQFERMQRELGDLIGGRTVDPNAPQCLGKHFREKVLAQAEVVYVLPRSHRPPSPYARSRRRRSVVRRGASAGRGRR